MGKAKLGQMLVGVGDSLGQFANTLERSEQFKQRKLEAEDARNRLDGQLAIQKEEMEMKRKEMATNAAVSFSSVLQNGLKLNSTQARKNYFKMNEAALSQFSQFNESLVWDSSKADYYSNMGEQELGLLYKANSAITNARADIENANMQEVAKTINEAVPYLPNEHQSLLTNSFTELAKEQQNIKMELRGNENRLQIEKNKQQSILARQNNKPNETLTTFDRNTGKSLEKDIKSLPSLDKSLNDTNIALRTLGKVETGVLAGQKVSQLIQKLGPNSAEAQSFGFAINRIKTGAVLKAANELGVRGVDTPAEQKRIMNTVANEELDASILEAALLTDAANTTLLKNTIEEKRQFIADGGRPIDFKPSLAGKDAYYNRANGEISFYGKEDKIPSGFKSIQSMWPGNRKSQVNEQKQDSISIKSGNKQFKIKLK